LTRPFDLGLELLGLTCPLVAPELAGVTQDALQFQPKAAGASSLVLQHLIDILLEVVQAFLLLYAQQLLGIVTLAAVGDHHSRIVGRNQFPDLFVAMPAANLEHRGLVGVEGHQMGRFPVNPPTGVIGVDGWRSGHSGT
jgi:hypothetical protein